MADTCTGRPRSYGQPSSFRKAIPTTIVPTQDESNVWGHLHKQFDADLVSGMDMIGGKKSDLRANSAAPDTFDRKGPFRLMGLPPELRNQVYAHILTLSHSNHEKLIDARCDTAILRVSRQVNSEARNIIYQTNGPMIRLHNHAGFSTHNPSIRNPTFKRPYRGVALDIAKWPEYLAKMESVAITLQINDMLRALRPSEASERLPHWADAVFSLCCFLQTSTRLRRVVIEMGAGPGFEGMDLAGSFTRPVLHKITYSLSRLVDKFDCKFVHSESDGWDGWRGIEENVREIAASNRDLFQLNTLAFAQVLQQQLVALSSARPLLTQMNQAQLSTIRSIVSLHHKKATYDNPEAEAKLQRNLWYLNHILEELAKDPAFTTMVDDSRAEDCKRIAECWRAEEERKRFVKDFKGTTPGFSMVSMTA